MNNTRYGVNGRNGMTADEALKAINQAHKLNKFSMESSRDENQPKPAPSHEGFAIDKALISVLSRKMSASHISSSQLAWEGCPGIQNRNLYLVMSDPSVRFKALYLSEKAPWYQRLLFSLASKLF